MGKINLSFEDGRWAWIALLIVSVIAAVSIYIHAGAMLHPEADAYLVDHLSDRPYVTKILCPHLIDAEDYMARPVSHFFENIDAHLFYFFYKIGFPHFISVTTMIMLLLISAAVWFYATRYAMLSPAIATLMLALLWTNPNVFLAGGLFRDAKIAATFFFILAGLHAFGLVSKNRSAGLGDFAIIFVPALLACLSDPQGLAFMLMLCSIALVWAFFTGSRPAYVSFASGLSASLSYLFLSLFVLPGLVSRYTWFNVQSAFVRYQESDVEHKFFSYLRDGIYLHLDTLRFLFGSIPRAAMAVLLVLFCIAVLKISRHGLLIAACFILLLIETFIVDAAMVARHNALMWPEVIGGGYYQLPSMMLFFTAFLFLIPSLRESFRIPKSALAAFLVIIICANIFALPYHLKMRKIGQTAGYYIASPILRKELVILSGLKPAGPPLSYDAIDESNSVVYFINSSKDLRAFGGINMDAYMRMSRIYSFLCSKKGLPYYKNW